MAVLKKAEGQTGKNSNSSTKTNKSNKQATYRRTFAVLISLYKFHFNVNTPCLPLDLVLFVAVWRIQGKKKPNK